jgi:hypothetical protein
MLPVRTPNRFLIRTLSHQCWPRPAASVFSPAKKDAPGRLGQHRGKTLIGGARLVRPSRPRLHMLAYKDLTRGATPRRGSA